MTEEATELLLFCPLLAEIPFLNQLRTLLVIKKIYLLWLLQIILSLLSYRYLSLVLKIFDAIVLLLQMVLLQMVELTAWCKRQNRQSHHRPVMKLKSRILLLAL